MKHGKPNYKALIISCLVSFIILLTGFFFLKGLTIEIVFQKLLIPLLRLICFISAGIIFGQIIEYYGFAKKLAVISRPFFKFGRLGDRCGSAFTTAFISGIAANGMLFEFYKQGKISKKQVYLTNFINHLPAYFLHFPTTFFIVVPLTQKAGIIYFAITFTATLLRVSLFLLYGHIFFDVPYEYVNSNQKQEESRKEKSIWNSLKKQFPKRMINIFTWVVPIYIIIYIINTAGGFKFLNQLLSDFIITKIVPAESLSVVILSFVAEFTSGFAAAGALLNGGVITVQQTVIALLAGNIVAFPIRALRHQLPRYIGIFSPKMGTSMLLLGQSFRILSIIFVATLYYMVF